MIRFIQKIKILFIKNNDMDTEIGRSNERLKRIAFTALSGGIAQMLMMAIPLITVRVSLNYMGSEIYGLWMAITSFFSLMAFADLGLGNGLQTELSKQMGKNDLKNASSLISNSYVMLSIVASIILFIFFAIFPFVNWSELVNAKTEATASLAGSVVLAIFIPKMIGVPLSLIRRSQAALQEGFIGNIWQCVASVLSLISVYIVVYLDLGVIALILISSIIPLIVTILNTLEYYIKTHKELRPKINEFDFKITKYLFNAGIMFFFLSILNTVGLSMDNFIVAKTCDLDRAATFSIVFRATQLINIACTLLSSPLWGASGEALERGDYNWVANTARKMSQLSVLLTSAIAIIFLVFGKMLFKIWLGHDLSISVMLMLGLLLQQVLFSFISPYFMVLNGYGAIRQQVFIFLFYTPISFVLKFVFGRLYGMEAIPFVGVGTYLIIVLIPTYIICRSILKKLKKGIN